MNEKHFILTVPNKTVSLPALERRIRHTSEIREELPDFWKQDVAIARAYIRGAFNGCTVPSVTKDTTTQRILSDTLSELAWLGAILDWRRK